MMTMTLDMTSQLAPIYWWVLAMLLALPAGFIVRHLIDPETLELYVGDRALLVATTAVVAATVAVLLLVDLASVRAAVSRSVVERPPTGIQNGPPREHGRQPSDS